MYKIGAGTFCSSVPEIKAQQISIGIPGIIARHGMKHATTMQLINELAKRNAECRLTNDEADAIARLI